MPIELVAEIGSTGQQSVAVACALADAVKAAGADAIKLMLTDPDAFIAGEPEYTYRWAGGVKTENMKAMLRGLTLTETQVHAVIAHCQSIALPWFATVDYLGGVAIGERLGCSRYKLSSWDGRNFPLIEAVGKTGKPVVVDLGPQTEVEVRMMLEALGPFRDRQTVTLVHTSHSDDPAEWNLRTIPALRYLGTRVGWSANGQESEPDLLAVALGAEFIEKRITLDCAQEGHHHLMALEPGPFKDWVKEIRRVEAMLGHWGVHPSKTDLAMAEKYGVSIHAAVEIPEGTVLTREMLCTKRPGLGESPIYIDMLVGAVVNRRIDWDTYVRLADVQP